ncbi:MAG: GSCFA domain-containing protein [Victivallales bacterium]|nr:GSCFA domain-containing protein [Victivallales bacterium]
MRKNIKFQTSVTFPEYSFKVNAEAGIAGIGSCFADALISRLFERGVKGANNPNGILYNSASIFSAVNRACKRERYTDEDFFEFNGLWHSWKHHGCFSQPKRETAVNLANKSMLEFADSLSSCSMCVITLSSSVVYELRETGAIVANCHKVPQNKFEKKILSVQDNLKNLEETVKCIFGVNQDCRIVITLSPVRHYPGDLILNSRSKSALLCAIHDCVSAHPDKCYYFPAYEILNDELRDYRFYAEDMLHPSPLAQQIIFDKFVENFFDAKAAELMDKKLKALKAASHRPLKPATPCGTK